MQARTIRRRSPRSGLSDPRSLQRAAAGRALLPPLAAAAAVVLAVCLWLAGAPAALAAATGLAGLALGLGGVWLHGRTRAWDGALAALARALESAREAFLVLGPDTRVRLANAPAAALIGLDSAALSGCPAAKLFGRDAARGAELAESLAAGRPWRTRFTPRSVRGDRQVEASFAPLHGRRGRVEGGVVFLRDVTHEARLEARTQRAQKLQALGQLAAGVVHDLNNLLLVIEGYTGQALSHAGPAGEPQQALLQIRRAARLAAELTARVLAFGRRQPGPARVVEFDAVLMDATPLLRQVLPESIELELEPGAQGRRVRVDPGQIDRVLLNLAANARDAMPAGGQLSIRSTGLAPQDPGGDAGSVLLEVADTGLGMDDATCEQIFEPFFSGKEERGAGLGLGVVFNIMAQCGGRIEVQTCLGEGTCFRIHFPTTDDPLAPGGPLRARGRPAAPRSGAQVLLVEDDAAVRELIGHQLRRAGFTVESAPDGRRALEQLASGPAPDLLVTDVSLPGLDGPGLVRRLRERWPELCVLYTSGYAADERIAQASGDPLADFLAKPFDEEALLSRIDTLLKRRRFRNHPGRGDPAKSASTPVR